MKGGGDGVACHIVELKVFHCRMLNANSSQSSSFPAGPDHAGEDGHDDGTVPPPYEDPQ